VKGFHRAQANDSGRPGALLWRGRLRDPNRAIGWFVDDLSKEGFTPRLVDSYWAKGMAIKVCHNEPPTDWLADRVSTLLTGEGSRFNIVGLDAFPTYKRVLAWFPGTAEDAERYLLQLRRLKPGLDTRQ